MAIVGYARVSTLDQDLTSQLEQLQAAGAEKVFSEQKSGAKGSDRPALRDMLDWIREGDVLVITRLDRLGRSVVDLFNTLDQIQAKGAAFRCLTQAMDTTTAEGRLMFGVLAVVADFERHMIKERQADGIERAKAAGVYKKKREPTAPVEEIVRLLEAGWGPRAVAKKLGIDRSTVTRHQPEHLKSEQPPAFREAVERRRAARHAELRP